MRLPRFEYLKPETIEQAVKLLDLHREDARILAGGTDLLVRMKKQVIKPKFLISLKALNELSYIRQHDKSIKIGAKTSLADITGSDLIQQKAGALFQACEKIGAVTIQHHKGTIGGNILQDNRCHHYNQSELHRSGRQSCHKDGGKICYARQEADRCNSTCQSDGATALMALDAKLVLAAKNGQRTVDMKDFYTNDGITVFDKNPDELLKEIIIPVNAKTKSSYKRLAYRSAIDYPIVSAAAALTCSDKNTIDKAVIVVGSMGRSPLFMAKACSDLKGKKSDDVKALKNAAQACMKTASPFAVHNVGSTLDYRCEMVSEMVFQALMATGSRELDA